MGGEDREQPRTITVLPDQSQIGTLTRQMGLSDMGTLINCLIAKIGLDIPGHSQ